tara:strand:+ start:43394 stop:43828 length:435 start_codon:yes stop_codon:yes gene_type:complete
MFVLAQLKIVIIIDNLRGFRLCLIKPKLNFYHLKEKIMKQWSKAELKIYILLLCAKADKVEDKEELTLIKSKTSAETFDKIYKEFCRHDEDESLEKIQDAIAYLDYSNQELATLKMEIQQVFATDSKVVMKERNLGWILDNILY